jgi:hypothetical protein
LAREPWTLPWRTAEIVGLSDAVCNPANARNGLKIFGL